jgi:hypothetical protein
MKNYIIGTGWWCDGTGIHTHSKHQHYVDKETRQVDFFNLWYKSISNFTNPSKIILIDSNSPIKPNLNGKENVNLYSLSKNYGAAVDGTSKGVLSGWDRSILLSASIAFLDDCDYFVYVEQDCILWGKNIIEDIIEGIGDKKIVLGSGLGTPQPIQQSLVIIKKDFIPTFLHLEMSSSNEELKISPENRYYNKFKDSIKLLDIGYGRKRPINFNDDQFYAQHLNTNELNYFKEKIKNYV